MEDKIKKKTAVAFDKYIRRCAKNKAIDLHRKLNRLKETEVPIANFTDFEQEEMQYMNVYSPECGEFFETKIEPVLINNEALALALRSITPTLRDVLLLSICFEMSDKSISDFLSIPRSTVNYRRNFALELIRDYLEAMNGTQH